MPEKRGRKRRQRERRHGEPGEARPMAAAASASPQRDPSASRPAFEERPKLRVRMAGFVLALLTLYFGILTAADGIDGGTSAGSFLKIAAGAALVVLALVIGALALFPDRVRALLIRK
jgi:hypothetical protein